MRILFLTMKAATPSTRWRVTQIVPALRAAGVHVDTLEMTGGVLSKLGAIHHASEYDVVVLQKRLLTKLLAHRLRTIARRLVFEFDDSVQLKKSDTGVRVSATRERRFRRILRQADAVVAPNEYLADLARREIEDPVRVRVIPTAVDTGRWSPRGPAKRDWPYVVGWVGTAAQLPALEVLAPALARSCRRHRDLTIRVLCETAPALAGVRVEHRPFLADSEASDVREFDIAIAPVVEDAWTRGKVSTRLLAYFAAGLPVVASDVGCHRGLVEPGKSGFLAGTLARWEEHLEALFASPDLRDRVGAEARRTAEERFSIRAVVPQYLDLFRSLCAAPVRAE